MFARAASLLLAAVLMLGAVTVLPPSRPRQHLQPCIVVCDGIVCRQQREIRPTSPYSESRPQLGMRLARASHARLHPFFRLDQRPPPVSLL